MSYTALATDHPARLGSNRLAGVWRLVDPKIALASIVPMILGAVLAARFSGSFPALAFAGAFLAVFAIEVGKNAVNDLFDFRSGADVGLRPEERSPFSGGKRVIVDGLLTETETAQVGYVAFAVAAAVGSAVSIVWRPELLILGIAGAAIAAAYTLPPFHLSYRGLGELAVFLVYGPAILLGTIWLLSASIPSAAIPSSITLGALIANVLLVNEFPDERADRAAGKRTLVVRLGRPRARLLHASLFALAWAAPLVAMATGAADPRIAGLLAGLPFGVAAVAQLRRAALGAAPVPAQALTLGAHVTSGLGAALAFGFF